MRSTTVSWVACLLFALLGVDARTTISNYERRINAEEFGSEISIEELISFTHEGGGGQDPLSSLVVCREGLGVTAAVSAIRISPETPGWTQLEKAKSSSWLRWSPHKVPAEVGVTKPSLTCISVALGDGQALHPGETTQLGITWDITEATTPSPAKIVLAQPALVTITDSVLAPSPYTVLKQSLKITTGGQIERVVAAPGATEKYKISATETTSRRYEAKDKIAPWGQEEILIHYHYAGTSFARAERLVREITVSHWGGIQIDEWIDMINHGPTLTGGFSRYDYDYATKVGTKYPPGAVVTGSRLVVPGSAYNAYYRDEIGNVSSSDAKATNGKTIHDLRFRFPLMGGWKTRFNVGWSLPLAEAVVKTAGNDQVAPDSTTTTTTSSSSSFLAQVDVGTGLRKLSISDLETRIVFPEGAEILGAGAGSTPLSQALLHPVNITMEKKYTYLDTQGRPVVVIKVSRARVPQRWVG